MDFGIKNKNFFWSEIDLVKNLYFFTKKSNFIVFSSELKSLVKFPLINLKISKNHHTYYSMLGYVPAPLCIYQNTFKVMPSEIISFSRIKLQKKIFTTNS